MATATALADPRRRTLAVLAAIALVAVVLAVLALWQRQAATAPPAAEAPFLPGFAARVDAAARIHVMSHAGTFDVQRGANGQWTVPERGNYPASLELVRRTLVGLAALQTIQPKTARPEWLHFVDLETPPKGNGILIQVYDDHGRPLAALIVGKSEDIGDTSGATGLFVRHPSENQTWLVRSVLDPRASLSDWVDKKVLDIDRTRIREVNVEPPGTPGYALTREKPTDMDFKLAPVPAGKTVSDATPLDSVGAALSGFGFDDVRPAKELNFGDAAATARYVAKTFDGLDASVTVLKQGTDFWATLSARAEPGKADAAQEAAAINAKANGWAYKLPAFKGQLFMTTLDSLVQAPAATPPPVTPAP